MISKLILIRHADTGDSNHERFVGATNVVAAGNGLRRIRRLNNILDKFQVATIYSSPLLRARQTAEQLQHNCVRLKEIIIDERLREIDFGDWEMKSWQEIVRQYPKALAGWSRYAGFAFPGGESVDSFVERVAQILAEFKTMDAKNIVVVTHGGVIRTMICLSLGLPARHYLLFNIQPGRLSVLDMHTDGALLSGLNL